MTTDVFEEHRSLLTGIAYRILGTASDAEDVVQEAWLRWSAVDPDSVDEPRAYLVTVASRLAIDRLRSARVRRETYVGAWLPEPVSDIPDGAERAELADSVEFALLVVLETLSPLERAVFVLREAFQMPYAEIGGIIGREEAAVRQLARRAREHVRARRPRFEADRTTRRRMTERFLRACLEGDLDGLTGLLADDVTLVSDSDGRARAPRRVMEGAAKVGRFLSSLVLPRNAERFLRSVGLDEAGTEDLRTTVTEVNGGPAAVISAGGRAAVLVSLDIADDRIQHVYLLVNPEKMSRLRAPEPS
ncbi:RNA polymerase sigma-70 factor (ECF subfamily) [Nocardiopsis arvandica]|uniref:RNA polymerase sigma-70 factor (ECF subfamily) n=1 Tax=Nocardiopsis sinuspersici TaxID=501010 RepID=A0A7Z0BJP6_9ACTN|nr:RNA polymerase sigma factor SigJ [Nocardiopsis sinuspersici]NYH53341.1 RNA polymerase sigma-70 factor (ECF subfamily) [Nocardiopsis sinuspersici]